MRELVLFYGSQCSLLKLILFEDMIYEGWIGSWLTYVHKSVLENTQGCTRVSEQSLQTSLIDSLEPNWVNQSIKTFFGLD